MAILLVEPFSALVTPDAQGLVAPSVLRPSWRAQALPKSKLCGPIASRNRALTGTRVISATMLATLRTRCGLNRLTLGLSLDSQRAAKGTCSGRPSRSVSCCALAHPFKKVGLLLAISALQFLRSDSKNESQLTLFVGRIGRRRVHVECQCCFIADVCELVFYARRNDHHIASLDLGMLRADVRQQIAFKQKHNLLAFLVRFRRVPGRLAAREPHHSCLAALCSLKNLKPLGCLFDISDFHESFPSVHVLLC